MLFHKFDRIVERGKWLYINWVINNKKYKEMWKDWSVNRFKWYFSSFIPGFHAEDQCLTHRSAVYNVKCIWTLTKRSKTFTNGRLRWEIRRINCVFILKSLLRICISLLDDGDYDKFMTRTKEIHNRHK